jgi:hypothetical protein
MEKTYPNPLFRPLSLSTPTLALMTLPAAPQKITPKLIHIFNMVFCI